MTEKGWLEEQFDLSDETIVITGGAGTLGSAMTKAVLDQGARVAVLTRNPGKANHLPVAERLIIVQGDVTDRTSLDAARSRISAEFGRVTALVNAAGGNQPGATTNSEQTFFNLEKEILESVIALNLTGAILPCQVFAQDMADAKRGAIVNISSMAAARPLTRVPAYAAAKAGVENFTKWLAVHMASEYSAAIRVNAIAPGFFLTEQNRFLLIDAKTGEYTQRGKSIIEHTPMKRFGEAADLIGALLWLLCPASRFVSGTVVAVDGGFSAFSGV